MGGGCFHWLQFVCGFLSGFCCGTCYREKSGTAEEPRTETLTPEQITEYKGVFEMFDEEGNGLVKTEDLEKLMSLLGINPTKRELVTMAKEVDKDNKGTLNCDGFLVLMGIYHEKSKNQDEELRAAFKVFDKEHKGYIDWNTLKYVLMNAGEPLNEQEAELMMKEADKDGDGTIDYEEFVAMMTGESFKLVQ
ncbi:calmodulin-like protein 6 isoform X1 [Emydura macquarii macquarii]|uniref:calmodulin-like protein 6 isoform X1 n=2 Tax=Emydura macquarii macquarii TaxID=1129001 RepID=UPI00352BA0F1